MNQRTSKNLILVATACAALAASLHIFAAPVNTRNEGRNRAEFMITDYYTTQTETGNDIARGTLESIMFGFTNSATRTCTVSFARNSITTEVWKADGTSNSFRYESEGGGVYLLTTDELIFDTTEASVTTGQVQYVILRD
jgi:hypothetical protein